jgi:hypothetical protein
MKINALENRFIFIGLEKPWLQIVFLGYKNVTGLNWLMGSQKYGKNSS